LLKGEVLKQVLLVTALVLALRLPFLNQAIQGDDLYYLYGAEHAQIEPLHPNHTQYLFRGEMADMRGHSHPPLNSWILGGLLAVFGEVKEVPFHLAYTLFSWIAALSILGLARRFSDQPLLATVLFCAVPAFVVNGNSLEADLPFLAFWTAAISYFVDAVDRRSARSLAGSMVASGLAALAAYQGIFLTPILAVYLYQKRRSWTPGWIATLAAPTVLAVWQIWERATLGAMPAAVLAGYMRSYHFDALGQTARGATALVVHLAWMVSPLILLVLIPRGSRRLWIVAGIAGVGAASYDADPLFWGSFALGVWVLGWCVEQSIQGSFPGWWLVLFFAPAMVVFFAGSARYLLPVAAPLAILAVNNSRRGIVWVGVGLELVLSLGLATVNYQHWDAYRRFASILAGQAAGRRVWVNADGGERYYLESAGALPLPKNGTVQAGDIVVSSALAGGVPVGMPLAALSEIEIRPRLPLRTISLEGRSAYSFGSRGLLPFEISTAPIDRVKAEIAVAPVLSYLIPEDPKAASQILSGLSTDGWTEQQATVILKVPPDAKTLSASFWVHPTAAARHASLSANGRVIVEQDLPRADATYTISGPAPLGSLGAGSLAVTFAVDKTFSVPGDARALGVDLTGIGFK
jgi:hypothetical protein